MAEISKNKQTIRAQSLSTKADGVSKLETIARETLETMEGLTELMTRETALVAAQDFSAMGAIRQEKMRLERAYKESFAVLVADPAALETLSPVLRASLKQKGEILYNTAAQNVETLASAVQATQALVSTIVEGAKGQSKTFETYHDHRKAAPAPAAQTNTQDPVAINQTV
ncbi:MAG: hypothetical protein FWF24_04000 [Alphaproteobacteria bacterium]|nr:hypothetical protein [Alphaproteobacteria bacterium]